MQCIMCAFHTSSHGTHELCYSFIIDKASAIHSDIPLYGPGKATVQPREWTGEDLKKGQNISDLQNQ